jgi:hypothetical protein
MYCYPDKINGNEDTIQKNEKELINKWLLKISESMLRNKKEFLPMTLNVSMKKITLCDLSHELVIKHKYQINTKFGWEKINYIQGEFLFCWDTLIREKIRKNVKTIIYDELSEMLKSFKEIVKKSEVMKGFRYQ